MANEQKEYAIYKTDKLIHIGTAPECMQLLDIKLSTFRYYLTPSYKRRVEERNAKNFIMVVPLDDKEVEEIEPKEWRCSDRECYSSN